jgi:hypothetical protein
MPLSIGHFYLARIGHYHLAATLMGGCLVVAGTVLTSEYEARKLARAQQAIS